MNTTGSTSQPPETPSESSPVQDVTPESENPSTSESSALEGASEKAQGTSKKFPVIEIFGPVIQGEGSQAGQQTMFIRFGGCDYRCQKCDSLHAVIPQAVQKHARYMADFEIVRKLEDAQEATGVKWVTFSGGNPCMHQLGNLVSYLNSHGWMINVETQGTLWQDWLLDCTMITVSPKSMGMGEKFEQAKFERFVAKVGAVRPLCVKVVVFSAQDFEMALHVKGLVHEVYTHGLGFKSEFQAGVSYYLSLGNPYPPILDEDLNLVDSPVVDRGVDNWVANRLLQAYRELSEEVLLDPRLKDFRFLPQLHVLVYGNESER